MDYFNYKNGELYAEDVPLRDIASEIGTPVYVYSQATILRHVEVFREALRNLDHRIFYSVKANSNQAVLSLLAKHNVGMDIVSQGEYMRARAAGVSGDHIVFSGVGKTREEIRFVLENGIYQFNVESQNELEVIDEVAQTLGKKAPVAFRINPDVDAKTHEKISTGKAENKFGIPIDQAPDIYARAKAMDGIELVGVDVHIGSQLTSLEPFREAFGKLKALVHALISDGIDIKRVDLGGGLGIPYSRSNDLPPLPMDYGKMVEEIFGDLDVEIGIEPGRMIMGNSGILLSEVIYLKEAASRNFLIVDAAMNDLLRPAMYDAFHEIAPVNEQMTEIITADIVGAVCETGDVFAKAREIAKLAPGDLIALRTAGAYGAVMASEYNSRLMVPEVLVNGDKFAVIRKRPSYEEMIARDLVPDWIEHKTR